jgi:hypothetical protein
MIKSVSEKLKLLESLFGGIDLEKLNKVERILEELYFDGFEVGDRTGFERKEYNRSLE